ncbi:hypothetical protein [Streptosporangium roseum]|uniref:hypothetical protein n=1 Tax=Streptosporangium roseum TaxID=2001 RepID=UPI0004CDC60F|nr:hypothetical protein [Streptosporangium roseum]
MVPGPLIVAQQVDPPEAEAPAVAWRQVAESGRRPARHHRVALEAGADPVVVAGWIREEQAGKAGRSGGSGVLGCAHAGSTGTGRSR